MTRPAPAYQKRLQLREAKRRLSRRRRLERQRCEAQRRLEALERSFGEWEPQLGLDRTLRRALRRQSSLLGQIFAMMLPTAFGAQGNAELVSTLGFDKNLPGSILAALPKRAWLRKFRLLGQSILAKVLGPRRTMSEATRSRWQVTLVVDSTVFRKFSDHLRLVAPAYSGQVGALVRGVDVVLLVAVLGDGKLIVPLDLEIRRPDPKGPGAPCYDKFDWTRVMAQRSVEWLLDNELLEQPPLLVADRWFASSSFDAALCELCGSALLVQGKSSWVFYLASGLKLHGAQLLSDSLRRELQPQRSPQAPDVLYARVLATSPSFGRVVLTLLWPDNPKLKPYYLLTRAVSFSSPRLIRAWQRRNWVEWCFRALKHLLRTDLSPVRSEDAYYGHLALRLMGLSVLIYTARHVLGRGTTLEQILGSIKQHWPSLESKFLDLASLSPTSLPNRA